MLPTHISSQLAKVLDETRRLTQRERLWLARTLLDSILLDEAQDDSDWMAMSLATFQEDWDNEDDAIYDNWREHYGVPEG